MSGCTELSLRIKSLMACFLNGKLQFWQRHENMHDYMGSKIIWIGGKSGGHFICIVLYVVVPPSRQILFSKECDWYECHTVVMQIEIVLIVWRFHEQYGTSVSGDSSGICPLDSLSNFIQKLTYSRLCAISVSVLRE